MKKIIYYFMVFLCGFTCLAGVSLFFINEDSVQNFMVKSLKLKNSPWLNGGKIASDFFDESCDDNGSGKLNYPDYEQFEKGSLDLIRYTVHKPVYEAVWQQNPEYWQLDLEFKCGIPDVRNIMVYIGAENINGGSTEPLFADSENVKFDIFHPWNFAVWVNKKNGTVYNSSRTLICETENYFKNNGKEIFVRIPLAKKELQKFYTSKVTWHYVVAGGFSEWDKGGFLPSDSDEKIYDLLDGYSAQVSQSQQLSSRTLFPVEVKMKNESSLQNSDFENAVKERYNEFQKQKIIPLDETKDTPVLFSEKLEYAVCVFEQGEYKKAEKLFSELVAEQENSALANAYYGSCLAIRGGNSNVFAAMKLVKQSFVYLDKAVSLCAGTADEMEVLLNRANVASSVPESVFKKSAVAGADFERIAELYKSCAEFDEVSDEKKTTLAYYYVCAAENFRKAGRETDAKRNAWYAEKIFQKQ
ncbi:glucodextranase DOMON-like domain-containing protein [uncultured Treponema sp.]|uniref:glucodextranase DOMON-like domain-containing protein n=1 Tax=uncultured Treponema sp. TaxID=162155 RepID=UPI0025F1C79F|nr:glucodextranase DOMON-like domain-containing protein [uncultured Treponema sp.]